MRRVNSQPALPRPDGNPLGSALAHFDIVMVRAVFDELLAHAQRLNGTVTTDGMDKMQMPLVLRSFEVASLPPADQWESGVVVVTNPLGGGRVLAYSDGTYWRRTDNGNVVA